MFKPAEPVNPYDVSGDLAKFKRGVDRILEENPPEKKGLGPLPDNPVSLGSRVLSTEEWANKQVERASNAASTWADRVKRPRKDPVEAALKAAKKREDKLRKSLEDKKWERAMEKVDKDEMYRVIEATGAEGFRQGIEKRKGKIRSRVGELQPMVEELAKTIDDMPDGTDAEREKRLLMARKGMIEIGKKRRGV